MTGEEAHRLELLISDLHRTVETGFATTRGDVRMLAHGSERLRQDLDDLERDVDDLKSRRFPLQIAGPLIGCTALVLSIVPYLVK